MNNSRIPRWVNGTPLPALALFFYVLLLFCLTSTVKAAPLQVGCDHNPNIRINALIDAIHDANMDPGLDVISLTAGCTYTLTAIYTGAGDGAIGLPSIQSAIVISGNGATILRHVAAPSFRVFQVESNGALTLSDLTLKNGATAGNGGAIYAQSALNLTDVRLISNSAQLLGGAVYVQGPTQVTGGHFEYNTGIWGGGLYVSGTVEIANSVFLNNTAEENGGGAYGSQQMIVYNSRFEQNQARNGDGGGLYLLNTLSMTNSILQKNRASRNGGGAAVWDAPPHITGSQFKQNSATEYGGGLFVSEALTLARSIFIDNVAQFGGGLWVGHRVTNGPTSITTSLFARNRAETSGAAMYLIPFWVEGGAVKIVDTTISSSHKITGTAIRIDKGNATLANTIITHHDLGVAAGTSLTLTETNNLYFANNNNVIATIHKRDAIITQDPKFVDPANDNYRLGDGSPAIDTGANLGIAVDLDGVPRPGNGNTAFDRGAYERQNGIADLVLHKSVTTLSHSNQAFPGEPITYTLVFSNIGSALATGVKITNSIPAIITDIAATYSEILITNTQSSSHFAWTVQNLPPGMRGIITLKGTIDSSVSDMTPVSTIAHIAASNEIVIDNNQATTAITIKYPPPVTFKSIYLPIVAKY